MTKRPRSILGPSKPIDRRIPGIGRIRCASGLPDGAQWRAMNDMVTELARDDEGRALLREVYEGRLQIDVLRTHHKQGTLHLVPLGTAASGLVSGNSVTRCPNCARNGVSRTRAPRRRGNSRCHGRSCSRWR
jgi:hypothetical protein